MKTIRFISAMLIAITILGFNGCKDDDKEVVWENEIVKKFQGARIECIDNISQGIVMLKFRSFIENDKRHLLQFLEVEDYKCVGYEEPFRIASGVSILGDVLRVGINSGNRDLEYIYFEVINDYTLKANGYTYKKH